MLPSYYNVSQYLINMLVSSLFFQLFHFNLHLNFCSRSALTLDLFFPSPSLEALALVLSQGTFVRPGLQQWHPPPIVRGLVPSPFWWSVLPTRPSLSPGKWEVTVLYSEAMWQLRVMYSTLLFTCKTQQMGRLKDFPQGRFVCCCSVAKAKSCLTLCNPMDCGMPGSPVLHHLSEFAQIHVHWVSDAI